jgi:hypothetical protein
VISDADPEDISGAKLEKETKLLLLPKPGNAGHSQSLQPFKIYPKNYKKVV